MCLMMSVEKCMHPCIYHHNQNIEQVCHSKSSLTPFYGLHPPKVMLRFQLGCSIHSKPVFFVPETSCF